MELKVLADRYVTLEHERSTILKELHEGIMKVLKRAINDFNKSEKCSGYVFRDWEHQVRSSDPDGSWPAAILITITGLTYRSSNQPVREETLSSVSDVCTKGLKELLIDSLGLGEDYEVYVFIHSGYFCK